MRLSANRSLRRTHALTCANCGAATRITGYLETEDGPYAPYFAELHRDQGRPEVWIDVILGTWGREGAVSMDHVTFACRVGDVEDQTRPGATLVRAIGNDHPMQGVCLSREQALTHPWLPAFWEAVDFILAADDQVKGHLARG